MATHELPGDELIAKLAKGGTGLLPYEAPQSAKPLNWRQRRQQAAELKQAAEASLRPHIIITPAKGPTPRT
jgi:hypothetical protein